LQDSLLARFKDKFRSISFEAEQQMNENALAIERIESQKISYPQRTRNFFNWDRSLAAYPVCE